MPLDPQFKPLLDLMSTMPPLTETPLDIARANTLPQGPKTPVAHVSNRAIAGPGGPLPLRLYKSRDGTALPLLVFFHGGGWVLGGLDSHDSLCRDLCAGADCAVLAVDYRLAPESKFPAAADDCLAALRWAGAHAAEIGVDASRIVVAGDSAGGNLAAVTALRARNKGGPKLAGQLLIYPITDYYAPGTRSYRENADGYFLTRDVMIFFWDHYLARESDAANPHASPLKARDLSGLPPALVITAEFDPLRDEGEAYGERLRGAGVPTVLTRYEGAIHGFVGLPDVDLGKRGLQECCAWLRARFRPGN
jgi:acetyl esterase